MKRQRIEGKVVAVTGGARGIGLSIARQMVEAGARVAIGDIDHGLTTQVAKKLGVVGLPLDVRDRVSFAEFLAETRGQLGPVDVLVNNAGIMPMGGFLEEADGITDAQIDINLGGVITGMKLALPGMLERGSGQIINVASLAGRFAVPGATVYCATKFGLMGLTESAREEFQGRGVHFTVVLPARVSTDLVSGTTAGGGVPTVTADQVAEAVVEAVRRPVDEVTVPSYLGNAALLYRLAPSWLTTAIRKAMRADRLLTELDRHARSTYQARLERLAKDRPGKVAERHAEVSR